MQLSRRQTSVLILSLMATSIGQSLVFAILAPLGREVQLNEIQITSIVASSALVFGLVSPRWGRLSDRVGRKPIIIIGLVGYTLVRQRLAPGPLRYGGALASPPCSRPAKPRLCPAGIIFLRSLRIFASGRRRIRPTDMYAALSTQMGPASPGAPTDEASRPGPGGGSRPRGACTRRR